jgi:uncharacterized membrane protein
MMKKNHTYIAIFTIALTLCLSFNAFSQPGNPDEPVPFGFVELLIGAGALYGAKKVHDKNKDKTV